MLGGILNDTMIACNAGKLYVVPTSWLTRAQQPKKNQAPITNDHIVYCVCAYVWESGF